MDDTAAPARGLPYPRLVPASLLPPEDPSRSGRRTLRDWSVDVLLFLLALSAGALFFALVRQDGGTVLTDDVPVVDLVLGLVACVALWWRRRFPVAVALVTTIASTIVASAAPASIAALFGVTVHRRTGVALAVAGVQLAASAGYSLLSSGGSFVSDMAFSVAFTAIVTAWGMFVRARRQLVWTLRERAERAEAEQVEHAERARAAERARIAREMHDVLGHRISLMALHAGGLQLRPDLPPEQVQQTAGLLRETAQQALQELRGVIGVLRAEAAADAEAPPSPQPTVRDIARLVQDTRSAGARIELVMDLPTGQDPPAALGRDAYRVVQEALTNIAKHATGTATTVRVEGAPGSGLRVQVRNRLPVVVGSSLPGAGTGLLGLRERVTLSGGTFEHGPDPAGDFVVDARLTW